MRTPPFLFSRERLLYKRRESSSYFLEIEGIFQLCPRKYFTHTEMEGTFISFVNYKYLIAIGSDDSSAVTLDKLTTLPIHKIRFLEGIHMSMTKDFFIFLSQNK